MLKTETYRINGIVQGVGFRPFVHSLAADCKLNGWVLNDSNGVLTCLQGDVEQIDKFIRILTETPPPLAIINHVEKVSSHSDSELFTKFEIRKSVNDKDTKTIVSPDAYTCNDCINEMYDPDNRRYRYAFINCTNCGPRYSIIKSMPYDREQTTMSTFTMCSQCEKEYKDIYDRRYHAQPNACPKCGPELMYTDAKGNPVICDDIVSKAISHMLEGKILAIKSLGGFHLAVNAYDISAVKELRRRKKRDKKPFALMIKDVETIRRYAWVTDDDELHLNSMHRPIVLLRKKIGLLPEEVAPNNPNFGIMLPSAPLHYLLLENHELPVLVMTSGNISGKPIAFTNDDAFSQLSSVADYFLMNNRDIFTRIDDSIVRNTSHEKLEKSVHTSIRRSRGYAPYPVSLQRQLKSIFATGAELKTTIALSKDNNIFLSQHIGDLKNDEIFHSLEERHKYMCKLLDIEPEMVVTDMHPQYRSTRYFEANSDIPVLKAQHHHAHLASCMAENNIDEEVIGVILDGTGYGTDSTIWGGEFLFGDYRKFERCGHLRTFLLPGGDKAVKEPIRVAISLLYESFGNSAFDLDLPIYSSLDTMSKDVFFKMVKQNINTSATSSMGRLFDGVSSLLGVCHEIEYEAQAAIELEGLLQRDFSTDSVFEYNIEEINGVLQLDYRPFIRDIVQCISQGKSDNATMSRRFHSTIVDAIKQICLNISEKKGVCKVCLSGGVFMNEFLLVNTIIALQECGLKPYYQQSVPSNDGGISMGQIMIADSFIKENW
ncbi:MAG: carbamoyltransferase HypF [Desulfobacteraceae bacterium]|nr:carbamoyltransferase HypF [Desulfobacteraceae bacterium]